MVNDHECRYGCDTPETLDHLVLECVGFNTWRTKVEKHCNEQGVRLTMETILTTPELGTHLGILLEKVGRS